MESGATMQSRSSFFERYFSRSLSILEKTESDCMRGINVYNPYNYEVIAQIEKMSCAEVKQRINTAASFRHKFSRFELIVILNKAAALLEVERNNAARLITMESGLCLKDSRYEVERVLSVFQATIYELTKNNEQIFSCDVFNPHAQRKIFTLREPLQGVISAITPFNHPMNQVAHKICPAIATNNRVILKPSEKTPLSALFLRDLLSEAGLPEEIFQVVTGDPNEIASELICNEHVDLVAFTGSVAVGKKVASMAGYRRVILELGGNDPLIIMEDADLEKAAFLAINGSYKNSGQRCTAIKRILVEKSVSKRFTELLVEGTERWKMGDPMDESVDIGTLIDTAAAIECEQRVAAAISQGARLLHGHRRDGASYMPTVLDRVDPAMAIVQQETFGPVSPIIEFSGVEQAIAIANSTPYGLSSALCTQRLDYITRFIQALNVGTVNIWEVPGFRLENTPFGGIKASGLGHKEGIQESMKNFTNIKTYSLPWALN
ncbi:phosphonoacetaldehyde dehydrogenase [Pseudomonas sp. MHK4]